MTDVLHSNEERQRMFARLDEHGEERVRHLLSVEGFPEHWRPVIAEWLENKKAKR